MSSTHEELELFLKIVSNVRKIAMENMSDLQVTEKQPDRNVEANP
jgi:hypothetical protein